MISDCGMNAVAGQESVMPTYRGVCRVKGTVGAEDKVRITDDDVIEDDITEEEYNRGTYKPPLEDLGWCA